jgi:hypothetical protein
MKRMLSLFGVAFGFLFLLACGPEPVQSLDETSDVALERSALTSDEAKLRLVNILKDKIRNIARSNQTRTDNRVGVSAQLRPLIKALVLLSPQKTEAETLAALAGPWYNLWSNQDFGRGGIDLSKIFQVINPNGYYYNISQATAPNGAPVTGALRGAYAAVPGAVAIRFTKNGFVPGPLTGKTAADVAALADSLEAGTAPFIQTPGPIGITGRLSAFYVDADLRIAGGDQTPVFDDNGRVSIPGQFDLLYVLERFQGAVP